jgi:hypothetical protein
MVLLRSIDGFAQAGKHIPPYKAISTDPPVKGVGKAHEPDKAEFKSWGLWGGLGEGGTVRSGPVPTKHG